MTLQGRVALVTGSTSGIGRAIAQGLAAAGADVMLNGFGEGPEIGALQEQLAEHHGIRTRYHGADVRSPQELQSLVATTVRELGSLDILVNNAGIQYVAPIPDFPDRQWQDVLAVNLSAVFYTMRAAIPLMREQGWGRIINIASTHGLVASPHKIAYVAAKHGVVGATKVAAIECANDGVTVNAICPGWVLTPLVERQLQERARLNHTDLERERAAMLAETQPMLKFTTPEAIAALAVFLCSAEAATLTGAALPVDGGWVAH